MEKVEAITRVEGGDRLHHPLSDSQNAPEGALGIISNYEKRDTLSSSQACARQGVVETSTSTSTFSTSLRPYLGPISMPQMSMTPNRQSEGESMPTEAENALTQAEQHLLGAMMLDSWATTVLDLAVEDDLADARHRIIFRAIADMFAKNLIAVHPRTVIKDLETKGLLEQAGGAEYIKHIVLVYSQHVATLPQIGQPTIRERLFLVRDLREGAGRTAPSHEGGTGTPGPPARSLSGLFGPPPWANHDAKPLNDPESIQLLAELEARDAAEREERAERLHAELAAEAARMRPIETTYAGYRFRSRLEARWSVALDTLGIAWEYEPQGFVVDGKPYLPDFRLPDLKVWLEIKPAPIDDPRHAAFAATLEDGWRLIIAAGNIPDPRNFRGAVGALTEFEQHLILRFDTEEIKTAYRAARSARFEHGETGA